MRATETIQFAFQRWKQNFNPYLMISLEAFIITMVAQVVIVPLMVVMYFAFAFVSVLVESLGLFPIILVFILFYVLMFAISAIIGSITNPGLVHTLDGNLRGRKYEFGDLFRYGKTVMWQYLGLLILNMIVHMFITVLIMGLVWGPFFLILYLAPAVACLLTLILFPITIVLLMALLPVQYLVFITKYMEGAGNWECITRSYSFVFRHFGFSLSLAFLVSLVVVLISMVPFLSIIISLFMPAFLYTMFLEVYYEMGA
jgi:hypothetical protein